MWFFNDKDTEVEDLKKKVERLELDKELLTVRAEASERIVRTECSSNVAIADQKAALARRELEDLKEKMDTEVALRVTAKNAENEKECNHWMHTLEEEYGKKYREFIEKTGEKLFARSDLQMSTFKELVTEIVKNIPKAPEPKLNILKEEKGEIIVVTPSGEKVSNKTK